MSLHSLRSILALAPVLALLYLACGKTDPSPTQTESGGDAGSAGNAGSGGTKLLGQGGGGNSGSAGAGLSGGQGGLSGKGGSGPAGMGGQAATGGQGNATPEWKEIGKIQGYPILQLQNPSDFQAFEWKPCDWTSMPGCEQAFVDEEFLNWKSKNTIFVSVHDDGEKARGILLSFRNEEQIVALVGENGHIEDAFKNQNEDLFFTISSIHGTNYGINARQKNKTNSGAIAGKIGKQPHLFDWDNSGLFKGSIIVWAVLGKSYFATQWMSLGIQSYSLMGQNQTRLVEVEKLNPDALGIQDLISADDYRGCFIEEFSSHLRFSSGFSYIFIPFYRKEKVCPVRRLVISLAIAISCHAWLDSTVLS
jgi:hypothetical protein